MAGNQPNQPPQPSQAKANSKRSKAKSKRSRGRNGKQLLQPPQPSLAEAQAEAKVEVDKPQGTLQSQPPQPPLGNTPNQGKQKVKPRRRRGRKGKNVPRTALSTNKRSRDGEECEQAEVNPQSKRLRVDSPPVASQDGGKDLEEIVPLRPIKPKALPLRRSYTPFFPRQFNSHSSDFKSSKSSTSKLAKPSAALARITAYRLQRSKLHRANLKAKRDFPHTLESLACCPNSDTDSEYTPISRADSIPTSGQSTPEANPEPISNEDLFGLRAKPCSPAPPTPSTWDLSSDSDSEDVA